MYAPLHDTVNVSGTVDEVTATGMPLDATTSTVPVAEHNTENVGHAVLEHVTVAVTAALPYRRNSTAKTSALEAAEGRSTGSDFKTSALASVTPASGSTTDPQYV